MVQPFSNMSVSSPFVCESGRRLIKTLNYIPVVLLTDELKSFSGGSPVVGYTSQESRERHLVAVIPGDVVERVLRYLNVRP